MQTDRFTSTFKTDRPPESERQTCRNIQLYLQVQTDRHQELVCVISGQEGDEHVLEDRGIDVD